MKNYLYYALDLKEEIRESVISNGSKPQDKEKDEINADSKQPNIQQELDAVKLLNLFYFTEMSQKLWRMWQKFKTLTLYNENSLSRTNFCIAPEVRYREFSL